MLLFDSLRCMFPLLVGSVNLTQKEVDGAGRNLDPKSIRTVGGPLQLFVPIGAVFHEVVEQGIQMVIDVIAAALFQRLFQIPFPFRQPVERKRGTGCIIGGDVIPLGNFPGFLRTGCSLL